MKILFVEDSMSWVNEFLPQLQTLGEVIHFKGSNAAIRSLDEHTFDLIVCDHNILRFEEGDRKATGDEIYHDARYMEIQVPFIHFSYEPCPEEYNPHDHNFYSLRKDSGAKLLDLIKQIIK